ncbi:hypothetical protein DSX78_09375, partial [Campylobacter jejuni]|nr:hypothetical protein [Campylobacter jejuni]
AGVKVLSLDEMKEVKGGYQFVRNSNYDYWAGSLTSYGYEVRDDKYNSTSVVSNSLGYSSSTTIVAKYRYVNNQKDYYLQSYTSGSKVGTNIWAYANSPAYEILRQFKNQY